MFDIGGWEFLLIAILGIIIIGPKELPGAIRTVSMFVRRARELARDFQSGLEEVARDTELETVADDLKGMVDPGSVTTDLRAELEDAVDPDGDMREAMKYDTDWSDDDLVDYDSPEFADENRIAPEDTPEPAETDDESKTADSVSSDDTPDKAPVSKPDTPA